MFRINPLAKHTLKASRASLISQQTRSLRIEVDNFFNPEIYVPPTMADYRARMSDASKSVIYKWEIRGRRNNETLESLMDAMKDSFKKTAPYKLTPEMKSMITQYFGYSEEEIDMSQDYDTYMKIMFQEDGTPNWEKWKEHIGQGSTGVVDAISRMQDTITNLKKRAATKLDPDEIKRKQYELHNIDFSYFEGKLPSSTLNQVIGMYKALVAKYEPDLDTNEINRLHFEQLNRAMTEIVDELGVMKRAFIDLPTEKIVHFGPMFQTDENGQPLWDFNSFAFIDRFFPEIRDVVLREMAVENYRLEYPVEQKRYATTYDDTISKMHKHAVDLRLKEVEARSGTVKVGGNKRQVELARALQNVADLLEEASNLAREAQSSKGEEESASDRKQKKAKEAEEEVVKTTTKEEDEFVWTAIEEQTGMTRQQMFGGRSGDYEPIDINLMLDEEEKRANEKK